jgi:hypothetical protein
MVEALELQRAQIDQGGTRGIELSVLTTSGWTRTFPGDWIVRWPAGDFEVCSDVFFS